MDKRAWVHQLKKQKEERGEDKASWYVSWADPSGKQCRKSCGPGKVGESAATKLADKIHSQLVTGTYAANERATWDQFFEKYTKHVESKYDTPSRLSAMLSIRTFVRIAKPNRMRMIDTSMIDGFIGKRRRETGTRKDAEGKPITISLATINRELRYLKAALRLAKDWKFIEQIPRLRFEKPQQKLPTFTTPEHFGAMFQACSVATLPSNIANVSPPDWWRGLLVLLYMTGWRIGQTLKLKREDIDLTAGTALSRAVANKGRRDQLIPLHPLAIEHLTPLATCVDSRLFPWNHDRRTLWAEFGRIQEAAKLEGGKSMPKAGKNGSWYGFHDLRRGFATVNAASMNLFELQALMQHQSIETTKGYINMAGQLNKPISRLFVPKLPELPE